MGFTSGGDRRTSHLDAARKVRRAVPKNFYALRGAGEGFKVFEEAGVTAGTVAAFRTYGDLPSVIFRGDDPPRREQAAPGARQQTRFHSSLRNVTCLGSTTTR